MAVNPLISSESGVAVFAKSGAANLVSYYTFLVVFLYCILKMQIFPIFLEKLHLV